MVSGQSSSPSFSSSSSNHPSGLIYFDLVGFSLIQVGLIPMVPVRKDPARTWVEWPDQAIPPSAQVLRVSRHSALCQRTPCPPSGPSYPACGRRWKPWRRRNLQIRYWPLPIGNSDAPPTRLVHPELRKPESVPVHHSQYCKHCQYKIRLSLPMRLQPKCVKCPQQPATCNHELTRRPSGSDRRPQSTVAADISPCYLKTSVQAARHFSVIL
jgi:hypothetical protein